MFSDEEFFDDVFGMSDSDEIEEFGEFVFAKKKKKVKEVRRGHIVGHLCSPINENDPRFLLENDLATFRGCKRHTRLKEKLIELGECVHIQAAIDIVGRDPIGYLQRWIKNEQVSGKKRLNLIKKSPINLLYHKHDFLKPFFQDDPMSERIFTDQMGAFSKNIEVAIDDLKDEFEDMLRAEKIKDKICFKDIEEGYCVSHRGLLAEPDICILKDISNVNIVFSTNLLLCALDKVQSRFNLLLYTKLADLKRKYEGISMFDNCKRLIEIFENLRTKLGNAFFDIMNTYESWIIGWVVADKNDLGCEELFRTSYEDLCDIFEGTDVDRKILKELLPPNRSTNMVKMYIELTGLIKCFGYPILDARTTLDHVKQYGIGENYPVDSNYVGNLEGMMRKRLIINYYKKYGKLPVIKECPKELEELSRGKLPKDDIPSVVWRNIKFGKSLTYDFSPDQSDLIKDSAAAVSRSSWATMFDPCAFKALYGKRMPDGPKSIYPTRVILNYLNANPSDVRRFITDRDDGNLNREDHIYVECQKECELNKVGRAFTKQTPPQRLIQTSMEHNIAESVFPLVPEQSMIDSEIKNVRRHLQQAKDMKGNSHFINIDLKKWCLHHRHVATSYIGKIYDELFGFKSLYQSSHLFSNGCWVFANNRLCPPNYDGMGNPIEGEVFTNQFTGGMEGMQQKKWTHGAVTTIQLVSEEMKQPCEIMAQGDNIVILLTFSKDDTQANKKRKMFLDRLEIAFRKTGHRLKEKETWFSSKLHEYSKQRMYEGCSVSYALKKCAKVIPDINDGLFSIPSSLSTINTITEGIARADYDADIAFVLNGINIINYLDRKGMIREFSEQTVLTMLNWPVDFGGINLSNYHNHVVRGNDDKITVWLSVLNSIKKLNPELYKSILSVWILAPERPASCASERKNLYDDIFSLNVKPHASAASTIREKVVEFLKGPDVTNPSITNLYDRDYSVSYDNLIETIDQMRPMYPQLAHELVKNSNAGIFLRLQGKLSNSKTLEKVINLTLKRSLITLISDKNNEMKSSVLRRLRSYNYDENSYILGKGDFCPTEVAQRLRKMSWGIELLGVTKPPWSHQCLVKNIDKCLPKERKRGILVRVSGEALDYPDQCHKIYGPMKPFVGSKTKEKVVKKSTVSIQEKSNTTKAYLKILRIEGWMKRLGDKGLLDLIAKLKDEKQILFNKGGISVSELENDIEMIVEGNLFHRFKSSIERDTAMVNSLPSVTGHFEYSSNSMKEMTAGGKDYNIFYQYIYTSCTGALAALGRIGNKLHPGYMILFNECICLEETPNPTITMSPVKYQFAIDPPDSSIATISTSHDTVKLKRSLSVLIGRMLAKNVDNNYRTCHQQRGTNNQANEYRKELISINDMRQVDFEIVLITMTFFSNHCRELFNKKDNLMLSLSEDRSFMYVAELVLESDLICNLLCLIGERTNEHGGLTSSFGVSSYISRNIGSLVRNVLNPRGGETRGLFLIRFTEDNPSIWVNFFKFYLSCCNKLNLLSKRLRSQMANCLRAGQNIAQLARYSNLTIEYEPMLSEDIIRSWKLCDRGTVITTQVTFKSIGVRPPGSSFPIQELMGYHAIRSLKEDESDLGFTMIKVSQLSFIARPLGSISSACNKAIETFLATGIYTVLQGQKGYSIHTAEGSGSIMLGTLLLFPNLTGIYNTLMRPDVSHRELSSDTTVPAIVDLQVDPSRVDPDNTLITGETDILTPEFFEKYKKVLIEKCPLLITMDAESLIETNNLHFVRKFIVPSLRVHKCHYLVKLFQMVDLTRWLKDLLDEFSNEVEWLLYKPMSSNPVGPEIYLVISPLKGATSTQEFRNCVRMSAYYDYVKSEMSLTERGFDSYIEAARGVRSYLSNLFPTQQFDLHNRYSIAVRGKSCGVLCPIFFESYCTMLDEFHLSEGRMLCHIATRSKGLNSVIYQRVHDFIFLSLYHNNKHNRSLYSMFLQLAQLKVGKDITTIRKKSLSGLISWCPTNRGDIFSTWQDGRSFIRELWKVNTPCSCVPVRKIWSWDLRSKLNVNTSISYTIYKWLADQKIINNWGSYNAIRGEPVRQFRGTLPDPICNSIKVLEKLNEEIANVPDFSEELRHEYEDQQWF